MNLDSLKDLLLFLNFTQHQSVFTKEFTSGDHSLSIDFDKKEIIYPEDAGLKSMNVKPVIFPVTKILWCLNVYTVYSKKAINLST